MKILFLTASLYLSRAGLGDDIYINSPLGIQPYSEQLLQIDDLIHYRTEPLFIDLVERPRERSSPTLPYITGVAATTPAPHVKGMCLVNKKIDDVWPVCRRPDNLRVNNREDSSYEYNN